MTSIEGMEPEPDFAAEVFGDRIVLARGYANKLAADSETFGLLGPRELPKIWSRHVINSALVAELVHPGASVVDVGSGAGLPGIPMAIARPDVQFTLVEPMERRANWLKDLVAELGLDNVLVFRARAEDVAKDNFDYATARAVAALDKLVRMLTPLIVASRGTVIAMKGSRAGEEIEEARAKLTKLGYLEPEIVTLGLGKAPETATVVQIKLGAQE